MYMKVFTAFVMAAGLFLLVACGAEPAKEESAPEAAPATQAEISEETTEVDDEPEEAPAPQDTPEPDPIPITRAEDLVGTWYKGGRNTTHQQFREDGTYHVAFDLEDIEAQPNVVGDYWFEDGKLFIQDVETYLAGGSCGDTVGTYEVALMPTGRITFTAIEDICEIRANSL